MTRLLLLIIASMMDGDEFSRALGYPKKEPHRKVDELDYFESLSLRLLLALGVGNHDSPDDQQLENDPDKDQEEDRLGNEAHVGGA